MGTKPRACRQCGCGASGHKFSAAGEGQVTRLAGVANALGWVMHSLLVRGARYGDTGFTP
jgi:hypothetical protein